MASTVVRSRSLFDTAIVKQAVVDSFRKLTVSRQVRNPVMFVVYVGSVLTTLLWVQSLVGKGEAPPWFIFWVAVWLWFTVLFANFAEALAEARGRAQADTLRATKRETPARRLRDGREEQTTSSALRSGDLVLVKNGVIRITADPGKTFLDRMIALVEGAVRQKTPNELALSILLSGLTIVFLLAVATLQPFAMYANSPLSTVVLVALLVCLIPAGWAGCSPSPSPSTTWCGCARSSR